MSRSASTRQLASARLALVSDLRTRAALRALLAAVLVALAAAAGLRLHADGVTSADRRTGLERENATLRAEVARLQAELELERATRSALGRQVHGLSQQVADLDSQLGFFHAQSGRPRRATPPN
jgi:septal ring factor EnvC (AmiA/AmiB activator)